MTDLTHLMSGLVDRQGKLLIPGIYDKVAKLEAAEAELYKPIDFDMVQTRLSLCCHCIVQRVPLIYLLVRAYCSAPCGRLLCSSDNDETITSCDVTACF